MGDPALKLEKTQPEVVGDVNAETNRGDFELYVDRPVFDQNPDRAPEIATDMNESFLKKWKKQIAVLAGATILFAGLGIGKLVSGDEKEVPQFPTTTSDTLNPGEKTVQATTTTEPQPESQPESQVATNSQSQPEGYSNPDQKTEGSEVAAATSIEDSEKEVSNGEYTVENLEIDASLINDPEKFAALHDERITAWYNAGATPENVKAAIDSNVSLKQYAAKVADEYDEIFISALFADDWKSNPSLVDLINKLKTNHQQTLLFFFQTYPYKYPSKNDIEPYERGKKTSKISVVKATEKSISIDIITQDYSNADQNRVGEQLTDGVQTKFLVVEANYEHTIDDEGKAKISNFKHIRDIGQ